MRGRIKQWVISDTHFGHDKLKKEGNRPDGYDQLLLRNIDVIGENDVLYHLGDVAFYDVAYWNEIMLTRCRARSKILVLGNHDRRTKTWYYERGWDFVCESLTLSMFGKQIVMTHQPLPVLCELDRAWHSGKSDVNVHGHVHNTNHHNDQLVEGFHCPVIMEHDYKPILLNKLLGL